MKDEMRKAYIAKANEEELEGDPLDLRAELAVQRDLLYMFLTKQGKAHGWDLPEMPLGTGEEYIGKIKEVALPVDDVIKIVYDMIADITKVTMAISHQRKEAVLSMAEVQYLQLILEETFVKFIPDAGKREQALRYFGAKADRKAIAGKVPR